ncbi:MAG: lipopolysaccharide assembly protein LapA domain-containing protein [Planctomycetota bacterium]
MLQKLRWFVILTGLCVVLVVAFQNQDEVPLKLLFFRGQYPLTLLLLATAAVSFVVGCLVTAVRLRHRQKRAEAKAKAKQATAKADSTSKTKSPAETPSTQNASSKSTSTSPLRRSKKADNDPGNEATVLDQPHSNPDG